MAKLYLMPPLFKMLFGLFVFLVVTITGTVYLQFHSLTKLQQISFQKMQLEREIMQGITSKGDIVYLSQEAETDKAEYAKTLKQFPPESRVNDLLTDITKLGTSFGLKFLSFKPESTVNHHYYAAIPVDIAVVGKFHQIGNFLSGIANLPGTVVVVNPLSITRTEKDKHLLTLKFTATIYHTVPMSLEIA